MAYKGSVSQSFIMSLAEAMADSTFLTLVRLKNYKSIGACDVELGPLTFLIGPNGSGKSNFLDALRFVADGLRNSLDHALRDRGGIPGKCGGDPAVTLTTLVSDWSSGFIAGNQAFMHLKSPLVRLADIWCKRSNVYCTARAWSLWSSKGGN